MMPASQKIITKLRERWQIEADLRKMLTAGSELEFRRQAQRIAASGSQVIPTIVGNLDRADARMLAAMGTVAAFLDRDEVTAALRQAIFQPQRTDQGRLGAMTILERFLGEPLDDDLMASLADPEGIAISSLDEVLSQAESNPSILISYVEGLDREEPDVVLAVTRALQNTGDRQAVEPLRMMAQDVREEIAAEALQALGTIRLPESARALQTLIPIVAPILRPLAERLLRKLRFVGVEIEPLPPPAADWRALISPVDARGQQSVWFIQEMQQTAQAQFLNILLNDRAGAVEAMGRTQVLVPMLPPRRSMGHVHDFTLPDGSGAMLMLEAPFDLGRRLVFEALAYNRETQIPIAGPLRLLSPWLWGVSGADSLPPRILPELPAEDGAPVEQLLEHPAFITWTVRGEAILRAADEASRYPGWKLEVWVRRLAGEMFADPMVARVLSRRLLAMSEWLLLARDQIRARLALRAAKEIAAGSLQEQPFVLALIRRDLDLVLRDLEQGTRDSLDK